MYTVNRGIETLDNELMPVNPELVQLMEAKEEQKRLRSQQNRHDPTSSRFNSRRKPSLSANYLNDDDMEPESTNLEVRRTFKRPLDDDEMKDFIVDDDDDDQAVDYANESESAASSEIGEEAEVRTKILFDKRILIPWSMHVYNVGIIG
jgi:hypothetical protein